MKKGTLWKLLLFNVGFIILEVVLYSGGLLNLKAKLLPALLVGLLSAVLFVSVNYWLLSARAKSVTSDLKDAEDYESALRGWIRNSNPFQQYAAAAVEQLHQFQRKYNALKALTEDNDAHNPFFTVSEDVQNALFENAKKLINRMTVVDPMDRSRYEQHRQYLVKVLEQNRQILTQYDNLLIEVSQIGDTSQQEDFLNLEAITNTLREMRSEEESTGSTQAFEK